MLVEFVVGSPPCSEGFSPGTPVFLFTKTNINKFQFDLETVDDKATLWKPLKFPFTIIIYLFIYVFTSPFLSIAV